jgi:hypothetical protein
VEAGLEQTPLSSALGDLVARAEDGAEGEWRGVGRGGVEVVEWGEELFLRVERDGLGRG